MNKLIFLLILMAVLLFGCSFGTQLTIENDTGLITFTDVSWNETDFGDISDGGSSTSTVTAGDESIYFTMAGYNYRTLDSIAVADGEQETFIFLASTLIVSLSKGGAPVELQSVK